MPCSLCRGVGHNKRCCPTLKDSCGVNISVSKSRVTNSGKKQLSLVNIPGRDEAASKLKIIELDRHEQYVIANNCVESLMNGVDVMVKAEEKTGKRCILEAINLILIINHYSNVPDERIKVPRSVYITALNRKDTKIQFEEQENEYGILSVSTSHDKLLGDIVNVLNDPSYDGHIYMHLDECDYGTGQSQTLSKLYNSPELQCHKDRISYITYSATPEEIEYSGFSPDKWDKHVFTPSDKYFGAQTYLDRDLVHEPEIFFNETGITEHGNRIIEELRKHIECDDISKKQRNVIVVRDTTPKNLESIRSKKDEISEKLSCEVYIFNQSNSFEWGNPKKWGELGRDIIKDANEMVIEYKFKPVLIFISQICTRSTEICSLGHRKLYAWHDARKLVHKKAYNTLSQAIGRIKHYSQEGHPENTIKLYCDIDILNYTVGNELVTENLVLSHRIKTTKEKQSKVAFVGYADNFGNGNDPIKVPDPEWQSGDPSRVGITFHVVNGKWCHYDNKLRLFGDLPPGSTNHGQDKTVLQYESATSERYIIRRAKYKVKEDTEEDKPKFGHSTKSTSMYTN
jgi:hypothetical protein